MEHTINESTTTVGNSTVTVISKTLCRLYDIATIEIVHPLSILPDLLKVEGLTIDTALPTPESAIEEVRRTPVVPAVWGVAPEDETPEEAAQREAKALAWQGAAEQACRVAEALRLEDATAGQIRDFLAPFLRVKTIITTMNFEDLLKEDLWRHDMPPQISRSELSDLAHVLSVSLEKAPRIVDCWHLPYISESEKKTAPPKNLAALSAMRIRKVLFAEDPMSQTLNEGVIRGARRFCNCRYSLHPAAYFYGRGGESEWKPFENFMECMFWEEDKREEEAE